MYWSNENVSPPRFYRALMAPLLKELASVFSVGNAAASAAPVVAAPTGPCVRRGRRYLFSGTSCWRSKVLPASRQADRSATHRLILPARCRQHANQIRAPNTAREARALPTLSTYGLESAGNRQAGKPVLHSGSTGPVPSLDSSGGPPRFGAH